MNQIQVPLKSTCKACQGEGYLTSGQTFILCGREHMQLVRCSACEGKGTLLDWVDAKQLAMLLRAIEAEEQAQ